MTISTWIYKRKQLATSGVFVLSVGAFFLHWQAYAFSGYPMEGYDGAIKYLLRAYVWSGLVPYQDFGIMYLPGMFFLAHLAPVLTLEQQNIVMCSVFLLLTLVAAVLLGQFGASRERYIFALSGLLLLVVPLLDNEDIADLLLGILIITTVASLQFGIRSIYMILLFLLPFLVLYWRYDRLLPFLCIETVVFLLFAVRYWWKKKKKEAMDVFRIMLAQICGLTTGFVTLSIYFSSRGGMENAYHFLYRLPVQVVYEYRMLPVPPLLSFSGGLFFLTWFILGIFFLYLVNELLVHRSNIRSKQSLVSVFLFFAPFSALPYALGRSDNVHIRPMLFFTGLSILLSLLAYSKRRMLIPAILLVVLVTPAIASVRIFAQNPYALFSMSGLLEQSLRECKEKMETAQYRSLFVGRTVYERYYGNILFFIALRSAAAWRRNCLVRLGIIER